MSDFLSLDGSFGEGGGQIVRAGVALSAITGRALEIHRVRGGRAKPGLQPQHLASVRAAATLCGARLAGDEVGSQRFSFEPQHPVTAGDYHFSIGTAGAAPLVVQTVLLPLALAPGSSSVRVTGGTHVPHSPPFEYLEATYLPALREAGLDIDIASETAGFFPKGGGEIAVKIGGNGAVTPLDWRQRGALRELRAFIVTSRLPAHVAERGADTIERAIKAIGRKVIIERREKPSPGPGAAVVLAAECESGGAAFSSLGELRRPMEKVAEKPPQEFMKWWKSGASCDEHLADQLVLPLSFASAPSHFSTSAVTEHLRTVIWVVQQFLDVKIEVEANETGGLVSIFPGES